MKDSKPLTGEATTALVRSIFGKNLTGTDVYEILWACTSYPFGSCHPQMSDLEWYENQLRGLHKRSNGDIRKAMGLAWGDLETEMRNVMEEKEQPTIETLVKVVSLDETGKFVKAIIPGRNKTETVNLPLTMFPESILEKLEEKDYKLNLTCRCNVKTPKDDDLVFDSWKIR